MFEAHCVAQSSVGQLANEEKTIEVLHLSIYWVTDAEQRTPWVSMARFSRSSRAQAFTSREDTDPDAHDLAMRRRIADDRSVADRVNAVSGKDPASPEHPTSLPVREAELGFVEGILTVDPPGEAVPHERCIDCLVEPFVLNRIDTDQRRNEVWAVAVEEVDSVVNRVDDDERDLRAVLPFPFNSEIGFGEHRCQRFVAWPSSPVNRDRGFEELRRHELLAPLDNVKPCMRITDVSRITNRVERHRYEHFSVAT